MSDTDTSTFFGTIFFWHWLRYQYWHQTKWKIPRISRDQDVILYAHWEASLPPEKMIFWKTSKTNLDQPPPPKKKNYITYFLSQNVKFSVVQVQSRLQPDTMLKCFQNQLISNN